MKYKPNKNQITWGITIFVTISMCVLVGVLFSHAGVIGGAVSSMLNSLAPILYGVVIAFLLNPVLNFLENKCLNRWYEKRGVDLSDSASSGIRHRIRAVSVLLCILLLVGVIAAIIMIVVPQLIKSIQTIVNNFSAYIDNVNGFFEELAAEDPEAQAEIMGTLASAEEAALNWYENNIASNMSEIISEITSTVVSFGKGIWNFIIGVIVSIYLLYTKDTLRGQAKKLAYSLFRERWANEIIGAFRYIDITFIGFITGKILDSIIIGCIAFVITNIIGTPFPALMSVIIGITNIVPFFGPWIGGVIGGVIVFMISPIDCLWYAIMVLGLQLFDGYILGPKILGDSTGLSNFWVIFAIMFFGGVWGFVGWIVGVPLLACIFEFASRVVNHLMRKKSMGEVSAEHLQDVAYYENGKEHRLGEEGADRFYASRTRNSWSKALGVERHRSRRERQTGSKSEEGQAPK